MTEPIKVASITLADSLFRVLKLNFPEQPDSVLWRVAAQLIVAFAEDKNIPLG